MIGDNIFHKKTKKDWHFRIHHGPTLGNVKELHDFLPEMTDEQFHHHVTSHKNDFAAWIEDIHGPGTLSTMIKGAKTKQELLKVLEYKKDDYKKREEAEAFSKSEKRMEEPPETLKESKVDGKKFIDDKVFNPIKDKYNKRNEELEDRFDEISSRLEEAIADVQPEDITKLEDEMKTRYEDLRVKASDLRRAGKDVLIAALLLRSFRAKLSMALASQDKKDFQIVKNLLENVQRELDEAEKKPEVNVKKEVLALAGIEKR